MIVNQIVAAVDNLIRDKEGGALRLCAFDSARVEAVHAFVVDGIDMGHLLLERDNVDQGGENDRARDCSRIELADQPFDGDDGDIFRAVGAGHKSEDGAAFATVDDDNGDACSSVDASGDFKVARGFLTRTGGSGTDCESPLRMREKW